MLDSFHHHHRYHHGRRRCLSPLTVSASIPCPIVSHPPAGIVSNSIDHFVTDRYHYHHRHDLHSERLLLIALPFPCCILIVPSSRKACSSDSVIAVVVYVCRVTSDYWPCHFSDVQEGQDLMWFPPPSRCLYWRETVDERQVAALYLYRFL